MQSSVETELLSLLRETGVVARVVLVILAAFSIWSWGIIVSKAYVLVRAASQSRKFWKIFSKGGSLEDIRSAVAHLRFTPLVPVFEVAVDGMRGRDLLAELSGTAVRTSRLSAVERSMHRAAAAQMTRLERHLTFLATTAAVAPFVGLFGTVWGVMTAFMGMANADRTTIQAVAPGIAEALIATAFGLFAAIPAVMAYNHFLQRIRNMGEGLDDLKADLVAVAEERGI